MILFGGAVLRASLTDLYLRYVKEELRPFLIGASLLLIVTGVMTLWYDLRPAAGNERKAAPPVSPGSGESPRTAAGHGHDDHGHHGPRVAWLLLLPVLGLLLVAPPALGSYAATQAGTTLTAEQDYEYPPLPAGDPVQTSVLGYAARALFDKGRSLDDRRVQLTGFVASGPGGEPILARMIMSCCAGDGRPVKVGMAGDAPAGLAADTWIEVTGRYTDRLGRDPVNDAEIPYIQVESWRQVQQPTDPYG